MLPKCPRPIIQSFLAGALAAGLVACTTNEPAAEAQLRTAVARGDANKLLVVDCLLPGQVRKLGTSLVYQSARRPVKTSAADCEIRGGEYVAYDRANYTTALAVWQPEAEAGDPKAQTYVGEIYERGLGTAPNYTLAAQWYRKAADQGYFRAQVNLGALYEQGRGAPKNLSKAINLYRQASGLTGDQVAFTASIQAIETERDTLRTELALRDREIKLLRAQQAQTEGLLETRRRRLNATERDLEETRRQLQRQKSAPPPATQAPTPTTSDPTIRMLEQRLADQQRLLTQQREEFTYLQQEADRQQAQLEAERNAARRQAKGLEQDVAFAERNQASLQQQVDYLQKQLVAYQDQLNARKRDLQAQQLQAQQAERALTEQQPVVSAEIQRLQQQLSEKSRVLESTQQQVAALEREVESSQEGLRSAQRQVEVLQADSAYENREKESLEQQVAYQRAQLIAHRDELNARRRELEQQRLETQRARAALAREQQASTQISGELNRAQQQLNTRGSQLEQTRKQVANLEAEVRRRQRELEQLRTIQAEKDGLARRAAITTMGTPREEPGSRVPNLAYGRYYALIIGNNQYQHLPNLETAVNDAQTLAQLLRNRYRFQTRVLTNASRYDILSAIEDFRKKLTEKDNFLLYYAGHGELDRANDRGNWLPVDAEPDSRANWIANTAITDILNSMSAKHIMVIADSCYSGTLARAVTTSLEGGRSAQAQVKWYRIMIGTPSRAVLTSGGERPVLDTGGGDHSLFARTLLDVLRTNQAILEGPLLYQRVASQVKTRAGELRVEQNPRYAVLRFAGDGGGVFLFVPAT